MVNGLPKLVTARYCSAFGAKLTVGTAPCRTIWQGRSELPVNCVQKANAAGTARHGTSSVN